MRRSGHPKAFRHAADVARQRIWQTKAASGFVSSLHTSLKCRIERRKRSSDHTSVTA